MKNKTTKIRILLLTMLLGLMSLPMSGTSVPNIATAASVPHSFNGTMMQYYEWFLPNDGQLWNKLAADAEHLQEMGITAVWLPPMYKGAHQDSNGYDVYDLWDLGEFYQKGTVRTKWGTRAELESAITALHNHNIQVYADIVINHRFGADYQEWTMAHHVAENNRNQVLEKDCWINAGTGYNFPGRGDTYSAFKWNNTCIKATTTDNGAKIWLFNGSNWDDDVDMENGNFDYLMGEDVDFSKKYVADHLIEWGTWLVNTFKIDGFRLDSVKHYSFNYQKRWLNTIRANTGKELFAIGEYWSGDLAVLENYENNVEWDRSVFDVPLHYRFFEAANANGGYDLSQLLNDTMMQKHPIQAVTFVDNHDTQPGQSLQSWIAEWFKPQAYTFILTRAEGYPCVFYGDYYGILSKGIAPLKGKLDPILQARKKYAYGPQHDGHWDNDILCWSREGDADHPGSGLAALISDGASGIKKLYVGRQHAGATWFDLTGNRTDQVVIANDGTGNFPVNSRSVSIWVPRETTPPESSYVTVYYQSGFDPAYIHYRPVGGAWTTIPGVKMDDSPYPGYKVKTINLGTATQLEACFTDGQGNWDSNYQNNYLFNVGVWTYTPFGNIVSGTPE